MKQVIRNNRQKPPCHKRELLVTIVFIDQFLSNLNQNFSQSPKLEQDLPSRLMLLKLVDVNFPSYIQIFSRNPGNIFSDQSFSVFDFYSFRLHRN